jgi:hypothetical protein
VKIRAILVQTKRSQKNAFGAALHTIPFDRVIVDKWVGGNQFLCIECTSAFEREIYHLPICQQHGARATFNKKFIRRRPPNNALR